MILVLKLPYETPLPEESNRCHSVSVHLGGTCGSKPLLKAYGIDNAAVVAWHAVSNAITLFPVEADGAWIVGSDLDVDFFQPGGQSALLKP